MLADEFGCCPKTICNILHELGKTWKKAKWVPHELTDAQKLKRVEASTRLLELFEDDPDILEDIVTVDEKWVGFNNPYKHNEWLSEGQKPSGTPVKDFRKEKRMLVVFWNRGGIVHYEFLAKGQTMNAVLYCEILERVRRRLPNGVRIILQHDNAKPHTAKLTKKWLSDAGWNVLEHPPYSPDLAPSDYHLFRSMEHWLRGKKFGTEIELHNSVIHFFNSKGPEFYARGN
jgi:histone-lysine N-methyltransferase SETMAR